jgi:malto-oligosyltrehalose synthase
VRVPVATYRLQVNDDFTLSDATAIVPYLAGLGISDLYLSPVFEARRGSPHGYDVTDPTRVRESIGGMDALERLAAEAQRYHMGILLDIVPNHMAASAENPWWHDVLRHGSASPYARFFDIDWGTARAPRRLRLPILGARLDELIARDEITIDASAREVVYHETRLPLRPDTSASGIRQVLDAQHYELVHWRSVSEEISYRRFFDITDLAGLRVEDDEVFRASHSLVAELARAGVITGLRIDHIDGLRDPTGYLQTLRERVRDPEGGPVYTIVEKILERSETLPAHWQCEGTTGYEFLSAASGLLISSDGYAAIDAFHRRITGDSRDFEELVREKKLIVMDRLFAGELTALAQSLARLIRVDDALARRAIADVTASMPVYRTYLRATGDISSGDRERIEQAVSAAIRQTADDDVRRTITAVHRMLLAGGEGSEGDTDLRTPATAASAEVGARLDWAMRWQQFTGPVMAKGLEDTALYCHNVLLAANDVGIDPARPALSAAGLHAALERRHRTSSLALNATATHDTKRGEDTRARMAVLSELPDEWRTRLRRWIRQGDDWKSEVTENADTAAPSADVESLLYQTLLGTWPLHALDDRFRERIKAYMTKAVREAKEQTSWRRPDEDYEQALGRFIELLMAGFGREGLADDVAEFAGRIAPHGALNSIAQMLLKITAPGIPDFYQGTELWSFTLVDPDNRASVDFALRRRLFDEVVRIRDTPDAAALATLLESWRDGRIKLALTALALRFRATHRHLFESGDVVALSVEGTAAEHVFAFARRLEDHTCITVVPRWTAALGDGVLIGPRTWSDTVLVLPQDRRGDPLPAWRNALTGETTPATDRLNVALLFRSVPFALLEASQPIGA